MIGLFRKKPVDFFTREENEQMVKAIGEAEHKTSGEIRVYIESRCRFVDPVDRAFELFQGLKMHQTAQRNAVLVYIAMKDRQLALYADQGIYDKTGKDFWHTETAKILSHFNRENYAGGISTIVQEIGDALSYHFPYDAAVDKNELPDDIVFGK
ncbi:MAG: TPM domain-containing protein [Filimonas sp.]|nr:TPM domain-containing protein [Filimonas sp.]